VKASVLHGPEKFVMAMLQELQVIAGNREVRKEKRKGVASIQKTKEPKRLEVFSTMRADFVMCGIGSDARAFLHNKGAVVSKALVPFGQATIALEALSETTNGDADSVMNPACQLPKFFEAQQPGGCCSGSSEESVGTPMVLFQNLHPMLG
jgi:hypothetical protein